ncbi:MAG TPA: HEPN domain-containing protein [Solirubrobacterales bacterium]|nr:HEPN domain-containing protein [Solirubrobacterales bacterium]
MPEREPKEEAAILARKAQGDAAAMRMLADDQEIDDEIIGFHAQQAVEKWLKAVIGSRGAKFEYTHDLRHLIELAKAAVGDFPFDFAAVIALTEYAVPLRYDELLDAEPLDREATVALVQKVGRWAAAQLKAPDDVQ